MYSFVGDSYINQKTNNSIKNLTQEHLNQIKQDPYPLFYSIAKNLIFHIDQLYIKTRKLTHIKINPNAAQNIALNITKLPPEVINNIIDNYNKGHCNLAVRYYLKHEITGVDLSIVPDSKILNNDIIPYSKLLNGNRVKFIIK